MSVSHSFVGVGVIALCFLIEILLGKEVLPNSEHFVLVTRFPLPSEFKLATGDEALYFVLYHSPDAKGLLDDGGTRTRNITQMCTTVQHAATAMRAKVDLSLLEQWHNVLFHSCLRHITELPIVPAVHQTFFHERLHQYSPRHAFMFVANSTVDGWFPPSPSSGLERQSETHLARPFYLWDENLQHLDIVEPTIDRNGGPIDRVDPGFRACAASVISEHGRNASRLAPCNSSSPTPRCIVLLLFGVHKLLSIVGHADPLAG